MSCQVKPQYTYTDRPSHLTRLSSTFSFHFHPPTYLFVFHLLSSSRSFLFLYSIHSFRSFHSSFFLSCFISNFTIFIYYHLWRTKLTDGQALNQTRTQALYLALSKDLAHKVGSQPGFKKCERSILSSRTISISLSVLITNALTYRPFTTDGRTTISELVSGRQIKRVFPIR